MMARQGNGEEQESDSEYSRRRREISRWVRRKEEEVADREVQDINNDHDKITENRCQD